MIRRGYHTSSIEQQNKNSTDHEKDETGEWKQTGGTIKCFANQDDDILDANDVLMLTKIDDILLELGSKLIMPNDEEMRDQDKIANLCLKTFQNIKEIYPNSVDVSAYHNDEIKESERKKKLAEPSSTTHDANDTVIENFTLNDLCEYLDKVENNVENWNKLSVAIITTQDTDIALRTNKWKDGLLSLSKLKDKDIFKITLTNENDDKSFTVKEKPWKLSKLKEFLSEFDRSTFPFVDKKKLLQKELNDMFDTDVGKTKDKEDYIPKLVKTDPALDSVMELYENSDKSKVLVIAGDSGSGKSLCATYGLQHQLGERNNYAFLYYTLETRKNKPNVKDNDSPNVEYTYVGDNNATPRTPMKVAVASMMKWICNNPSTTSTDTRLYKHLSESNRELNAKRNKLAAKAFKKIWSEKMVTDLQYEWWNSTVTTSTLTLDGVVIILDEVGKDLQFAYGVVEEARSLLCEILKCKKARKGKLVIVGAGLDDFQISKSSSLSTDPTLASLMLMLTPNKTKLEKFGISPGDLYGTYARVLSDNARMLILGLVPILTSDFATEWYEDSDDQTRDEKKQNARIAFGSWGPLMNYVCRMYVQQNGLKDLTSAGRENIFLALFWLYLKRSLENDVIANGSLCETAKLFLQSHAPDHKDKYPEDIVLFKYGLAPASAATKSSNAMKFLACNGLNVPPIIGNGDIFEELVETHLKRLCDLDLSSRTFKFSLSQAWPPRASKNDYNCKINSNDQYVLPICNDNHEAEIKNLKLMIQECKDNPKTERSGLRQHIVMRQEVQNAQGPDIFVLNIDFDTTKGTLDCYQIKNWKELPAKDILISWLYSLGESVELNIETTELTRTNIPSKEALYTKESMDWMIAQLSKSVGFTVSLGVCRLVIRQSAENIKRREQLNVLAKSGIVELWTSDFLEPTFSAIPSNPVED